MEVIVSMDGCIFLQRDLAKDLHADDSVDEEDEDDEDGDPGQGLEGLDEGPEEGPDALPLREQLDQPHDAEETEEGNRDHVVPRLGEEARSDVLKGNSVARRKYENCAKKGVRIVSQIKLL